MLVWSNRSSAKARGALPGCMLLVASRIRVARALSSRHAITSTVCRAVGRRRYCLLDFWRAMLGAPLSQTKLMASAKTPSIRAFVVLDGNVIPFEKYTSIGRLQTILVALAGRRRQIGANPHHPGCAPTQSPSAPQLFALCDCHMIKISLGLVSTSDHAAWWLSREERRP